MLRLTVFAVFKSQTFEYLIEQGWEQMSDIRKDSLTTLTKEVESDKAAHSLAAENLVAAPPKATF